MVVAIIIGAVLVVIGVLMVVFARKELARLKVVKDTPTTPASQVLSGFVEVRGNVEAEQTVISPFNQVPAVLCNWKVEEYRKRGKNSSWVTVLSGAEIRDFWIRDDSGRVRVKMVGAETKPTLYLSAAKNLKSGTFADAAPHVEQFLQAHGRSSQGWVFNKSMRYSEELIMPGEPIYGLGFARRQGKDVELIPMKSRELILANCTEEELAKRMGRFGFWMMFFGIPFIVGGVALAGFGIVTELL